MSRIRSQLENIRRSSQAAAGNRLQERPIIPSGLESRVEEAMSGLYGRGAPQQRPTGGATADALAELDRIRDRLARMGAPAATPRNEPAPRAPAPHMRQPVAPDPHAAAEMKRIRNDLAEMKALLGDVASRDSGAWLAEDLRRIADDIASMRDDPAQSRAVLAEVAEELHQIRQGMDAAAADRPAFDPSMVLHSIEQGYAAIASRLEEALARQAAQEETERDRSREMTVLFDQLSHMREMVESLPGRFPADAIGERLEQLGEAVAALSTRDEPALVRNFRQIEDRLDEVTRAIVSIAVSPPENDHGLDRIEARIASLAGAVEQLAGRADETQAADIVAAATNALEAVMGQMADLSQRVEQVYEMASAARGGSDIADAVQRQLDRLASRIEDIHAGQATAFDPAPLEAVSSQIGELGGRLDEFMRQAAASPADRHNSRDEEILTAIDIIAQRLEMMETGGTPDFAGDFLGAFEDRMAGLSAQVAELGSRLSSRQFAEPAPAGAAFDPSGIEEMIGGLAAQMDGLRVRLEERPAVTGAAFDPSGIEEMIGGLAAQMDGLRVRLEERPAAAADGGLGDEMLLALERLEARLADMVAAPAAAVSAIDASQPAAVEEAMTAIMARFDSLEPRDGDMGAIARRLDEIETRLAQSREQSRELALETAQQAAERVLAMAGQASAQEAQGREPDPAIIQSMAQELQGLEALSRDMAARSEEGFSEVRGVLSAVMARLDEIGSGALETYPAQDAAAFSRPEQRFEPVSQAEPQWEAHAAWEPPAAPRVSPMEPAADAYPGYFDSTRNAPPPEEVRPELEDVPLEPGSGAPDLAALVRDASMRRRAKGDPIVQGQGADFLAAARRAAQADINAPQPPEGAQKQAAAPGAAEAGRKSLLAALPSLLGARRKLFMGVAAAVLLAAVAIPVASSLFGGSSEIASVEPAAEAVAQAPQADEPQQVAEDDAAAAGEDADPAMAGEDTASLEPDLYDPLASAEADAVSQEPLAEGEAVTAAPVPPADAGNVALREAAAAGDANALFEIARRYTDGDGVERDLTRAAQWYEIAARAGSAPAQYRLANFLEKGHGVAIDVARSALWYQRAAEQGNALAMHNLGVLHTSGLISGAPDMETAVGWFSKAAEFGVKDSQVNLGIIYAKGLGVETDMVQAYKWLAVAARGGDSDAGSKRDTLARAMRPEQLEQARGQAELWKPAELDAEANAPVVLPEWSSGGRQAGVASQPAPVTAKNAAAANREMVAKVQKILAELGFDPGPADGIAGTRTREAVKVVQKRLGLPVDGEITVELLEKLSNEA